ncbi:MAG: MauE/DoxX family redox-associated membrane protein [Ignavibacteriaceae bacterium]|jgi:hypothetical protein
MIKKYLPRTIRVLVFLLFLISGIAKMFPVWAFEKQLVDLGIATWCSAHYFSRFLIALEIAIGFTILQRHYLKKIVIPTAIGLLLVFSFHLVFQMYLNGALTGNCGCFGQLIDMSPLAAFIKNVIMIGLLFYLYRNVPGDEKGENKFIYPILIIISSTLFMFVFFPFTSCSQKVSSVSTVVFSDSIQNKKSPQSIHIKTAKNVKIIRSVNQTKQITFTPPIVHSIFAGYTTFGSTHVNLDEGKKIICLFAAGCDHCRAAAKEIYAFSKKENFYEVYILFMDEETNLIPDFFKEVQGKFPYQVIDIQKFWQLLGDDGNTPGVFYLWNGNVMKYYEGTGKNKFDPESFRKVFESTSK